MSLSDHGSYRFTVTKTLESNVQMISRSGKSKHKAELCSFTCLFFTWLRERVHAQYTKHRSMPCPHLKSWVGGVRNNEEVALSGGFSASGITPLRDEWTHRLSGCRRQWFWFPCWSWVGPRPFRDSLHFQSLSILRRRTLTWTGWVLSFSSLLCLSFCLFLMHTFSIQGKRQKHNSYVFSFLSFTFSY